MAWERKLALASAICAAWCVSSAICRPTDHKEEAASTATPDTFACAEDLLPCQEFVYKTGKVTPSPSCCEPLDRAMATDKRCICAITENDAFLRSLNVSKDDFRQLVINCGMEVDDEYCKDYSNSTITRMPMVNPIEAVTLSPPAHARSSSAKETAPIVLPVLGMFFLRVL